MCQILCIGVEQVCEQALNLGSTKVFDEETKTPYTFKDDQWITYDDPTSLKYKVRCKQTAENDVTSCLARARLTSRGG